MEQPTHQGKAYKDMTREQKIKFVCKLVVSILTFGFAFPNIMGE